MIINNYSHTTNHVFFFVYWNSLDFTLRTFEMIDHKNSVLRTIQICFDPSRNPQASKKRHLDYRIQNSLSPHLHLFSSMRAAFHFQPIFNFTIPPRHSLPRRIFVSRFTVNISTFPIHVSFATHLILLIEYHKGISWKTSKHYGAHILLSNFSPSVTSHKSFNKAPSHGDVLGREYTYIFSTGTVSCIVTSLTHRPRLILNPSVPSDRSLGER